MDKKNSISKILIIRFSSIGDIVLTTPVMRCIKKYSSNIQLHFVTKKSFIDLLAHNPHVDSVFGFENSINELVPSLRKENYDVIIDLHNNIRSRLLAWQLHARVIRFDKLNLRKWLLVNVKINLLPNIHVVDRYLNTLQVLGIPVDGEGLEFYYPSEVSLPKRLVGKEYIALVIGGTHQTKKYPVHKLISLCTSSNKTFVLLGGKSEVAEAETITGKTGENVINMCGKLSLFESAKVVENAELVITNDTGLMHIASAFQKRIISIWGNTVPALGMYPYVQSNQQNIIVEVKDLSCRPCSKIGFSQCPQGHFKCMNLIDDNQLVKHIS